MNEIEQFNMSSTDENLVELNKIFETEKQEHNAAMPYIDHLDDAIVAEKFIIPIGEKVVIERYYIFSLTKKWLDTRSYIVKAIDHKSGKLWLFDHETLQSAMSNFIEGPSKGYRFKVATKKTRLKGRGRSKVKKKFKPEDVPKKSSKPGTRRVYDTKGIVHTRLKSVAYLAPEGTQATSGDRVEVSIPYNNSVTITFSGGKTEVWGMDPKM